MTTAACLRGALLVCIVALPSPGAFACAGVVVSAAWVRTPPPGASMAAAYLELDNRGRTPARIVGVESPDFESAMLHETRYVEGAARMRHVEAIELAPGAHFSAAPGGTHVMLMGARGQLESGTVVHLRLMCAGAAALDFAATVSARAPTGGAP